MPTDMFINPYNGATLKSDCEGNLFYIDGMKMIVYKNYDGCYDFVSLDQETFYEKKHYDKEYSKRKLERLTTEAVKDEWNDEMTPRRKTFLKSLGDIAGKRILLLGNGNTSKEIYFQQLGANVVLSDLSIEVVKHKKREFELSELNKTGFSRIEFHAVDALHLPFADNSFDIIYGSAFVHHLDDVDKFLKGVYRCLNESGICKFLDQATSPTWSFLKKTVFLPFKLYSYRRNPRSPADIRADQKGGFSKDEFAFLMNKHGFRDMIFIREYFFFRIVNRHYGKLFHLDNKAMRRARPLFLLMKWIDHYLSKTRWMKRNALMLVWGFDK